MTKKHVGTALRTICFLLGFCVLFTAASRVLNDKSAWKYAGYFYESGDEFEVLFAGSSLAMDDVSPLQLFRQTGVVSYDLGMTKEYIAVTYWRLEDAFSRQSPKVVVLEMTGAVPEVKLENDANTLALLHNSLDAMPLGLTKVRALADLFGWRDIDSIANYLFPISQFHTRYNALTEDDFNTYLLENRGALPLRVLYYDETPLPNAPAQDADGASAVGADYLGRIARLCRQNGAQLLLVAYPTRTDAAGLAQRDRLAETLCGEYDNVSYVNLFYGDVIDPATDMADSFGHLNTSGSGKLTAWLGSYLTAHYALTDRRTDAAYADAWGQSWEVSLRQHANYILSADIDTALMLLKQEGLGYALRLSPQAQESAAAVRLLQNLGLAATPDAALDAATGPLPEGAALPEGENALLVWNADTGEILAQKAF